MTTLTDLLKDKKLGSTKIRSKIWGSGQFFIPYFQTRSGDWEGLDQDQESFSSWDEPLTGWEVYPETRKAYAYMCTVTGTLDFSTTETSKVREVLDEQT